MDQVSQVVLALLRSALWGEENTYPSDTDWQAVTKELQAQAIMGVIAGSDIPECVPAQTRAQWESLALLQGSRFYRLLHQQDQLLALLAKNDIPLVILKGMAAAVYYPAPEMRAMGDVDFLVPREQVEKVYALMLANGYEQYLEKNTSNKHISLQKAGVRFELHRYFGIFDSVDKMAYMDDILQKGLQNIEWRTCAESRFPMLPPLANGLVLLEHTAGHFRDGLGLRHITDWMLYVYTYLTDAFWAKSFLPAAQALGLDVFAQVLTKMCQRHLGWDLCVPYMDERAMAQLLDRISQYGLPEPQSLFFEKENMDAGITSYVTKFNFKTVIHTDQVSEADSESVFFIHAYSHREDSAKINAVFEPLQSGRNYIVVTVGFTMDDADEYNHARMESILDYCAYYEIAVAPISELAADNRLFESWRENKAVLTAKLEQLKQQLADVQQQIDEINRQLAQ